MFDEILVYGQKEDVKRYPPRVIVEVYDKDKVSVTIIYNYFIDL